MPDERLLLAVITRAVLLGAALVNLRFAFGAYRQYRDARGLRGFAAAVTILAGVLAFTAASERIRLAYPAAEGLFRIVAGASVVAFLIGVIFSAVSWRYGR